MPVRIEVTTMNDVMGILNLSESDEHIKDLTLTRTIASIPILGRYRVVDFALSNMVNAGITNVGIYTYGKSRSLWQHLGSGKPYGLDRKRDGLFIFYPECSTDDNIRRAGDLEQFKFHLDYLKVSTQQYVILSRSYMICNIDYADMVRQHKKTGADVTIAFKTMENSVGRFMGCDTIHLDEEENVIGLGKNLGKERHYNISLEMYVLKREALIRMIEEAVQKGEARYLKEVMFNRIPLMKVSGYRFQGYLGCINSAVNYFKTNMDLLDPMHSHELFNHYGKIHTKVMDAPSTQYTEESYVSNSLIANGCIIEGTVENSVLCRDVHVKKGAIIRNAIIMPNAVISETTNLNFVILDKNVTITPKKMLFGDISNPFIIKKNMIL